MKDQKEILAVPSFRQSPAMCGPASLKMVLMYFNHPFGERTDVEIAEVCGTDPAVGTPPKALIAGAEKIGLTCVSKEDASFSDIKEWLDKKVPVIVDWFSPGTKVRDEEEMPDGHYSVVVGLDDTHIYIQDPATGGGLRTIERDEFYRVWFDFEGDSLTYPPNLIVRFMLAPYPKT